MILKKINVMATMRVNQKNLDFIHKIIYILYKKKQRVSASRNKSFFLNGKIGDYNIDKSKDQYYTKISKDHSYVN